MRRRLVTFMHMPANAQNDPREYGIWSILAGLCVLLFLMLAGWHFVAPYVISLLDGGALAEREGENTRLRDQMQTLHALDGTLESEISTLAERAADIDRIVRGSVAADPATGTADHASSPASYEWRQSPEAVVRRVGGRIDRLLIEVGAELASLQSIEAVSREDAAYWDGIPIVSPVRGPVSRSFGTSRNLLSDKERVHGGLDIAANRDEPVRATAYGVVSRTGVNSSLGRYVDITHRNGYVTRYGHLSEVLVERRKRVGRGDIIGKVGMTGKTSGYHVHYEIHHEGRVLNPSTWLFPDRGL